MRSTARRAALPAAVLLTLPVATIAETNPSPPDAPVLWSLDVGG